MITRKAPPTAIIFEFDCIHERRFNHQNLESLSPCFLAASCRLRAPTHEPSVKAPKAVRGASLLPQNFPSLRVVCEPIRYALLSRCENYKKCLEFPLILNIRLQISVRRFLAFPHTIHYFRPYISPLSRARHYVHPKATCSCLPVLIINGTNPVAKRQTLNFTPASLQAVASWFASSGDNLHVFEASVQLEGQSLESQLSGFDFGVRHPVYPSRSRTT